MNKKSVHLQWMHALLFFMRHTAAAVPYRDGTTVLACGPQAGNAFPSHVHRHCLRDVSCRTDHGGPSRILSARKGRARFGSGSLAVCRAKRFFHLHTGMGRRGRPVRDTSVTGIVTAVFEGRGGLFSAGKSPPLPLKNMDARYAASGIRGLTRARGR